MLLLRGVSPLEIRAVFFDMGGTLETYSHDPALGIRNVPLFRAVLEMIGILAPPDDSELAALITRGFARYKSWSVENLIELPVSQIWAQFIFEDPSLKSRFTDEIAEDLTFLYETLFFQRALRPEVPSMLAQLKSMNIRIGCISNVASRTLVTNNLRKYGIIQYFDPIILSSEYGRRKPDPAIFHHAAQVAQLPTDTCIYVGDRVSRDILGSKKAGYALAIQVRHDFDSKSDGREMIPDLYLQDLSTLIDVVTRLIASKPDVEMERRKIKAIFFDAGDILYTRPEKGKNFHAFLNSKGISVDMINESAREKIMEAAYHGKLGLHACYRELLDLYGIKDRDDICAGIRAIEADDGTIRIVPGVPETLRILKTKGYRLGIITDTALPMHAKLKWFDDAGFCDVWSTFTSSKVHGIRKPSPSIYRHALKQALVEPEEALFIGHKKSELEGARQMGMATVAFNHEQDASADYSVDSFAAIPTLPILKLDEDQ